MTKPLPRITPAEYAALLQIAAGATDIEAGKALFRHPRSVGKHRTALLNRFNARNVTALIVILSRAGLLDLKLVEVLPRKKKSGKSRRRS